MQEEIPEYVSEVSLAILPKRLQSPVPLLNLPIVEDVRRSVAIKRRKKKPNKNQLALSLKNEMLLRMYQTTPMIGNLK